MDDTVSRKWFKVFLLFFLGILLFSCFYYLATRLFDPTPYLSRISGSSPSTASPPAARKSLSEVAVKAGRFTLRQNQAARIDHLKIVYRGKGAGSTFRMDVIVLPLDPDYTYPYQLEINSARKGFRLGGRQFKLHTLRKSYVTLSLDQ